MALCKSLKTYLFILWVSLLSVTAFSQQDADLCLLQGLYEEEINGDLKKAMAIYENILENFPAQRAICASAQLQIALCSDKLGLKSARQAYEKVVENYPDQFEIVALAKTKLAKFKKPDINPLVKYYFLRMPPDIMTAVSYDGKFFVYTDWSTGNLMSKKREDGTLKRLTDIDFSKTKEYAYHPIWSRDGKFVAYSHYRGLNFIELRVVSVDDRKIRFIYSGRDLVFSPQDWDPNGNRVLCEVFDFSASPIQHRLMLVSMDGTIQSLVGLGTYTRGMKFSPDGQSIAFDLLKGRNRHVFLYRLKDRQTIQISTGRSDRVGFDSPAWSSDGKLVLYRNKQRGLYDLWATPIVNGAPAGESFIVDSGIIASLLKMKGIDETEMKRPGQAMSRSAVSSQKDAGDFYDDFSSPTLGKKWSVYEWKKPNVYGYQSFGRYSLTDRPGALRYYVDPMMIPGRSSNYLPGFDEWWYWYYPSLEIERPLYGSRWQLETRVTYSMVDGANSRSLILKIYFIAEKDFQAALSIVREKVHDKTRFVVVLNDGTANLARNDSCLAPGDTSGIIDITYCYRITRRDSLIRVELAGDDENYTRVLSAVLPPRLRSPRQLLVLTGSSWFVPAGSYAEWDYFRFRRVE